MNDAEPDVVGPETTPHVPEDGGTAPYLPAAGATPLLGAAPVPETRLPTPQERAAPETPRLRLGRYAVYEEIAHGGMGAVLRACDPDLRRDLAVKVLKPELRGHGEFARRFLREAQITGQLQHPGVVPVHDMGHDENGLPFLVMKLVRGRTLADLLAGRDSPRADLPRFVAIFEQICQTLAFAHARRVIHRDLKPHNVMVGEFGEVQVMDWGLAKVLDSTAEGPGGVPPVLPQEAPEASAVGSVLGTPAYMAPEQARGEVDLLDERADVFGLGAILCEILTGHPPYRGRTRNEVADQARRADLSDALARLEGCGADAGLLELARRCLAADRGERLRDAGAAARLLTAHLAGVQERLRAAERARAAAEAAGAEERKRRRVQLALAASVLVLFAILGGGWLWRARSRDATLARALPALAEAELRRDQAREKGRQAEREEDAAEGEGAQRLRDEALSEWRAALEAARRARDALEVGVGDGELRQRAAERLAEVEPEAVRAARNQDMRARLEAIRLDQSAVKGDHFDVAAVDPDYGRVFRDYGVDMEALPAEEAAEALRSSGMDRELAAALDEWARVRREYLDPPGDWQRLDAVARAIDPDPRRNRLRSLLGRKEWAEADRREVRGLAADPEVRGWPPADLALLGFALQEAGFAAEQEALLRQTARRHPQDFWAQHQLAWFLSKQGKEKAADAVRFYTAAVGLRPSPGVYVNLAHALQQVRPRVADAEILGCYDEALRREPDSALVYVNRGAFRRNRLHDLEGARADFLTALRSPPILDEAHTNLGIVLGDQGRWKEAVAAHQAAVIGKPASARALLHYGISLMKIGDFQGATPQLNGALAKAPSDPHCRLGIACLLAEEGDLPRALAEAQEALRLDPSLPEAHVILGALHLKGGQVAAAEAELREALRLDPESAEAHYRLGSLFLANKDLKNARAELREAVGLRPWLAEARFALGCVEEAEGAEEAALACWREAVRLKPDYAAAQHSLGRCLHHRGDLPGAVAALREAVRLDPRSAPSQAALGSACADSGQEEAAVRALREAVRLAPDYADAWFNLADLLAESGDGEAAVTAYRELLRVAPKDAEAWSNLGALQEQLGRPEEAIAALRQALRLQPQMAQAHCNLGHALRSAGRYAEALAELKRGHELGSRQKGWRYPSAQWVREAERLVRLEGQFADLLSGRTPVAAADRLAFAGLCLTKGKPAAAARFYAEAFAAEPRRVDDLGEGMRYRAARAAALAGQGDEEGPRWRRQALDWLRADLDAWVKVLDRDTLPARRQVRIALGHWQHDPEFKDMRDPKTRTTLPEAERAAWGRLWADADALLARARGRK